MRTTIVRLAAVILLAAGCRTDPGAGLVLLDIAAGSGMSASKIVVIDPSGVKRTYEGQFPPKNGGNLLLQVPGLTAGSAMDLTVQALDRSGCLVGTGTVKVTVTAGAKTGPFAVSLGWAGAACADGGMPGTDAGSDAPGAAEVRPDLVADLARGGADGTGDSGATGGAGAGGAGSGGTGVIGGAGVGAGIDAPVLTGGSSVGASGGTAVNGGSGASGGAGGSGGVGGGTAATGGVSAGGTGGGSGGTSALLDNGSKCIAASACSSNFCVDGVCCEKACAGCNACTQTLTGKADGICAPATSGKDPHDTCADETGISQCGKDGTCDGSGNCRKVGTDHQCTPSSCKAGIFTPASNCDGTGACKTVTPEDCAPFQCSDTEGCKKTCAVPGDCGSQSYCNTSTGVCSAKQADGVKCSQALECSSTFCLDGVCCHANCTGCYACAIELTGQPSGQCLPVSVGKIAHSACTASGTTCGLDGMCDGSGGCRYGASGKSCGSTCTGSTLAQKTCNGLGACTTGNGSACPGALVCAADGAICKPSCASNADCNSQSYCASTGTCATKLGPGAACTPTTVCASGNCVDGFCCESACTGTCQACSSAKTGATNGLCRPVKAGTDPDIECTEDTSNTCGLDGTCDGISACRYRVGGTACGSSSCTGQGTFKDQGQCNGSGTCIAATSTGPCPGNMLCATNTICATTCTDRSTTGCPSGYKCVNGGNRCDLATVSCGGVSCPVANGGGNCCDYGIGVCSDSPDACSSGGEHTISCNSKAECPAGQVCCAIGSAGSWRVYCATATACVASTYTWAYQICDPGLTSPPECPTGSCTYSFGATMQGLFGCQ